MQIVIYKLAIDSGPIKNLYTARKKKKFIFEKSSLNITQT